MLIFDIETNGLLNELNTIHCIALHDTETKESVVANDHGSKMTVRQAIELLSNAEMIVGHNIIAFDIPAIQLVFPDFKPQGEVRDTLLMSRLIYTDLFDRDAKYRKKHDDMKPKHVGSHSLEAWGIRLGEWKGDYSDMMKEKGLDPWAEWNQDMDDYCGQDVVVTTMLYAKLMSRGFSEESIRLEHEVAPIIARQERHGILFDAVKAALLLQQLQVRHAALEDELRTTFAPWQAKDGPPFIPKRDNKARGYVKGVPVQKWKTVTFNPGSRDHIANRLQVLRGWKPKAFTDTGKPKVDESIISKLRFPEAPLLTEYLLVTKRLGQIADGEQAWLTALRRSKDGRIHGRVTQNGAVTGRMTHSKPNMAQVPKVGSPYGAECRALFCVPEGFLLVGADASGLELRCLGHYMAAWDGGAYARAVVSGNSDDETDVHSINCRALGLDPKKVYTLGGKTGKGRDFAKTFIYAFLYGAGDEKIGSIFGKGREYGRALKAKFLAGLPALGKLLAAVKRAVKERGHLKGIDGRLLHIRSDHAALNTLLQSAGAIAMKKALVVLDSLLKGEGFVPGVDYEFVANVHDEWQIECRKDIAQLVGETATRAIFLAGESLGFRCPLAGEYKVGTNWAETH